MKALVSRLAICAGYGVLVITTIMPVQGQSRRKVAITFDQMYSDSGRQLNISECVSDALLSKLAGSSSFEVVDREYLNRIMQEQNLKVNGRFDASEAVKLGKLANIDVLVTGRIEAFRANTANETANGFFANKMKMNGEVELKVTSRLISVETASILAAPAASVQRRELLAQRTDVLPGGQGGPFSSKMTGATNLNAALLSLVYKSVDELAADLASQIQKVADRLPLSSHGVAASVAKVVGIQGGDTVLINRGSNAGIKMGNQFIVMRAVDTGLKDPDTGQSIIRKKKICTLMITETDDSVALGKCDGEQPLAGDEAKVLN